jgi:oxaloacetate decarboxylase alpha subunit
VGIQSVLNIVTGERYKIVPDEVIKYAAGHYGKSVAPIDANVLDKVLGAPNAPNILATPPEQPTIEELRRRYGTQDDDELILRALVPEADLQRMREAGPIQTTFPLLSSPQLEEVAQLMRTVQAPVIQYMSERFAVDLFR